jgi:hypothetical protein
MSLNIYEKEELKELSISDIELIIFGWLDAKDINYEIKFTLQTYINIFSYLYKSLTKKEEKIK